jgi:archaellum biogenesis ATPase FlaH
VKDPTVVEDLSTICEFEIVLRNVLPWAQQIRQVTDHHRSVLPSIDPELLDDTLSHIEQLVTVVAALRDRLNSESNPEAQLPSVAN